MYLQDNPRSTQEEAESVTEEFGYIRNIDKQIRWFTTTQDTEYYMPDASMSVEPIKVDYSTFEMTMTDAIYRNDFSITFVRLTVSGEYIIKIEWVFHP